MIRWTLTALLLAPLSAWAADKPDLEKLLEAKTFTEGKATQIGRASCRERV